MTHNEAIMSLLMIVAAIIVLIEWSFLRDKPAEPQEDLHLDIPLLSTEEQEIINVINEIMVDWGYYQFEENPPLVAVIRVPDDTILKSSYKQYGRLIFMNIHEDGDLNYFRDAYVSWACVVSKDLDILEDLHKESKVRLKWQPHEQTS